MRSDDSPDFKEPLEVVDLSKRHADEQEALKYGPPDYSGIGIVIDCRRGGGGQSVSNLNGSLGNANSNGSSINTLTTSRSDPSLLVSSKL